MTLGNQDAILTLKLDKIRLTLLDIRELLRKMNIVASWDVRNAVNTTKSYRKCISHARRRINRKLLRIKRTMFTKIEKYTRTATETSNKKIAITTP